MLYKLDIKGIDYKKVKRVTLNDINWKECDLQELLSKHIQDLIYANELLTIFNERPRQEEPDILALDKAGDLYIFELKRWSSGQENLLQVLRYGQLFGNSNYNELNELYQKYSKANDSLSDVHERYFGLKNGSCLKREDFNQRQHFLIVTNGLDQRTVEAISYWKKNGLNIDGIIYWVFEIKGEYNKEYFIEFNMYSPIEGYLEYESNNYVLNTNYSNDKQNNANMLKCHKAAAYCPGWREKIEKLQKGDTVFLYKSGTGIVAYGIADGKLKKCDYEKNKDYEYYMGLEDFMILDPPMSASQMKEVTNQGFPFRTTMFSISDECKNVLIEDIIKNHRPVV